MARISLRAYNHEIENLIDRGQIEEAIAHCKNIIKQFPKHIETYRLLGKAFLESQRYAEAADILQRVLSVYPDDFVSQLGMSIIREDEGNLDAAIWHMERAYEVQPFNRAVQDELRRLYGRRDGVEPPRIRLTRGALVRMYARGDLYPQAIAEIRAALAEDNKRVDLLALLSKMYYLSGQKIEATEICSTLIAKLPYCYEANRILKDVLPETSRAEDARIFQQRLFALDPYAAFISPNAPTSSQVPEQTVMVEKVDWQPSMTDTQSPDWARTIGVRWEDTPEEVLPDWLNTISPGEAVQTPSADSQTPDLSEPDSESGDELIPDFMKEAGWEPSDGTEQDTLAGFSDQQAPQTEDELVEADIPDWLKTLAPDSSAQFEETEAEDKASLDWLEGILPSTQSSEEVGSAAKEETQTGEITGEGEYSEVAEETDLPLDALAGMPNLEEQTADKETLSGWLDEMAEGQQTGEGQAVDALPEEADTSTPGDEIPNWLEGLKPVSEEAHSEISSELPEQTAEEENQLPDWIQQAQTEQTDEATAVSQPSEDLPDWLRELSTEDTEKVDVSAPSEPISGLAEDELIDQAEMGAVEASEELADSGEPTTASPNLEEMDMDSAMAWMEALAAKQGAEEESLKITSPEQRSETVPEWIKQQAEAEVDELTAEEQPTDVSDQVVEPPEEVEEQGEAISQLATEELPADQQADTEESSLESTPDEMDLDSAMAWMEALAAKQGADEDSLKISSPKERSETPPEWIIQQVEEQELPETFETPGEYEAEDIQAVSGDLESDEALIAETPEQVDQGEQVESESLEDSAGLTSLDETDTEDQEQTEPVEPSWVSEISAETASEQPEPVGDIDESPTEVDIPVIPEAEETTPEFVESTTEQTADTETESDADIPDWLRSYEEEQKQQEPVWSPDEKLSPEAISDDQLPDWLREEPQSQSASGSEMQETTKAPAPEIADISAEGTVPDWLKELQETTTDEQASTTESTPESTWVPEYQPSAATPAASEESDQNQPGVGGDRLALARASLRNGDLESAAIGYTECVNANERIDEVINDLKDALDMHPVDVGLWQALGDAYMHNDQIQNALDAYTKAEELLR